VFVAELALTDSPDSAKRERYPEAMAAAKADFEGDLDRLYQLPLNEFTAARDELTKQLRAQGERERAQEIKALRKPTGAVWIVNQLARERPLDVQRLLKAGESLTKSQAKAAAGKSSPFPAARRDEHHALEQLAKSAREIADRAGIGSPAVGKATETLRAASLTAEGRDLLKRGRLSEELQPPGFEVLTGLEGLGRQVTSAKPKPARSDDRAEKRRALKQAQERLRQLRAEERELASAARAAARDAERAEAEAEAARSRAADAQGEARAISDHRKAAEADLDRLG
jgi:hypothetical protein